MKTASDIAKRKRNTNMHKREELLNTARKLFGFGTITSALKNSGILKTQDQIEELCRGINYHVRCKEDELKLYEENAKKFKIDLVDAFCKGDLN